MSKEAMKQALEALKSGCRMEAGRLAWIEYDSSLVKEAINALEEELKQEQDELVDMYHKDLNCPHCGSSGLLYDVAITEAEKQKQDEPVAYVGN